MESQLEKEARFRQLMAHSSHDSAIDTDSMEWETEVVEFERETVSCLPVSSVCSPDVETAWGTERGSSRSFPKLHGYWFGGSAFPLRVRCILSLYLSKLGCRRLVCHVVDTVTVLGRPRQEQSSQAECRCGHVSAWLRGADCILGTEGPVSHEEGTGPTLS